ncbi:MAG: O-antigen ligase C-terminal domain-containing protein [Betaproteobacteria bacterium]|nr:O-antigen ligase C-terminal domain-containing protein [Betaproteobacteria bacterium]
MVPSADHSKPFARASLLLVGLMFVLPFLQPFHYYPLTSFYSEWLAFALGLAAATLLLRKEPWREAALPVVAIVPIGLAAVIGLQAALGRVPYPEQALTVTLYLLWAVLLVLLGSALRRMLALTDVASVLAWFLLAGGILSALIGLLQHYQFPTPVDFLVARKVAQKVYGNLGQPNHFASYVTLSLASAGYLYACRRLHGALAGGCMALFLLVLALSGSRSTWFYLGALGVLALLLHVRRRDDGSRRLALAGGLLLPGFLVALGATTLPFMLPPAESPLLPAERLFQAADGIEPRLQLWREAWLMFLGAPVLGAGWGQFTWHHFGYQAATGASAAPGLFNHAHNIVMQLMAETGLVGATIIVGALVLWLADLRRVRFGLEWGWLLALLAVIGIHSLLELPLWYSYFLGMAALLLGLGAERVLALRFSGAVRMVASLAVISGWVNLGFMLSAYRDFERLVFLPERAAARPQDDAEFAKAVVSLYREPSLVPYIELAIAFGVTVNEDRLPDKLALVSRAERFAPVAVVAHRRALLLALAGEREAALAQLERSLRVYPEDARDIAAQLEVLASRHPGEFMPLLELALARGAEFRARAATQ